MNPRSIVKKYFMSLFKIIVAAVVLLAFSFLGLHFSDSNTNAVIIVTAILLLIICMFYLPMIVYCFRVLAELKRRDWRRQTIVVRSIERARFHNYYYRGGGLVDEGKSILIDEEGKKFHFIGGDSGASKHLSREVLNITFLRKTGFLLSVELINESPNQNVLYAFSSCFYSYLSEPDRIQLRKKIR